MVLLLILALALMFLSGYILFGCVIEKKCFDSLSFFLSCFGMGCAVGVILGLVVREYIKVGV